MAVKTFDQLRKSAARVILCSALAISILPMTATASSGTSGRLLEAQFEDAEGFRLFKYRTLKALNELRDLGLTPQAIVNALQGIQQDGTLDDMVGASGLDSSEAMSKVSAYTSDIGKDIADTVQEQTQAITEEAAAAATRQMTNWADSLGRSIGQAIRDAIVGVLGGTE